MQCNDNHVPLKLRSLLKPEIRSIIKFSKGLDLIRLMSKNSYRTSQTHFKVFLCVCLWCWLMMCQQKSCQASCEGLFSIFLQHHSSMFFITHIPSDIIKPFLITDSWLNSELHSTPWILQPKTQTFDRNLIIWQCVFDCRYMAKGWII